MRIAAIILALPLLAAASAPVEPVAVPPGEQLQRARSEQAAAEREAARLDQAATKARGDLQRLRAEQAASAQAIEAAEARITAADLQLQLAKAYVDAHRQRLLGQQQPISSLLAGLAMMAQRPPVLSIADRSSVDDLVRVRILLNSTIPVIRARTAKLSAELGRGRQLEQAATEARSELVGSRQNLLERRNQFASLERRALELTSKSGSQALSAGDVAIAASENVEALTGAEAGTRAASVMASTLAAADQAPPRPVASEDGRSRAPFTYELPVIAEVTEGLANVNPSGVQARGITFATGRGAQVAAPAAGTVRFAGPYRDYDGVLIIDHGGGWMSLLVNVASTLRSGNRVTLGQPVGRTLGPLQVELSQYGRRISPAIIAGSSQSLSKAPKGS